MTADRATAVLRSAILGRGRRPSPHTDTFSIREFRFGQFEVRFNDVRLFVVACPYDAQAFVRAMRGPA